MRKVQALAVYALVTSVLVVSVALALLTVQETVHAEGSIKGLGIGIYQDPQCTNAATTLDFGQLEPRSSKSFTLYLKNEGNSALTLSMTSENWNPSSAADYMTLTWNREGQQISAGSVYMFHVALSVSADITGISSFSVDIIISGTG